MEAVAPPSIPVSPSRGPGGSVFWLLPWMALFAWNVWMTLGLFGATRSLAPLLDDRPVVSGRHPLHLYHGYLGARALFAHGTMSCYDPFFHAGYPKTPVFDGASRPAEIVLALCGGRYRPAAYKVALAVLCALVPLFLTVAARGAGFSRGGTCLAVALGLLVWWGGPCRAALEAGQIDLLLASLLILVQAGLLVRFHHQPGPLSLAGVVLAGFVGWLAHPLLLALLLPLFLIYYASTGVRHRLIWHLLLLGGLVGAVALNSFWLMDWINHWWIRVPLRTDVPMLTHRTFRTLWESPLWGHPTDRALGCTLIALALVGVAIYNETTCRVTARLFGVGLGGFLILSILGVAWEPVGRFGGAHLVVPALLFAIVPATHAIACAANTVHRTTRTAWVPLGLAALVAGTVWSLSPGYVALWQQRCERPQPLQIGLGPEREALAADLVRHTTADARILWEDRPGGRDAPRWTPLLPTLTQRSFLGGLDAEAGIEHVVTGLTDQTLAGKPIRDWSDAELADYCRRYNVGWVACWSSAAKTRFAGWGDARAVATLRDAGEGTLFAIGRTRSFALVGSATWVSADDRRIVLADVVPEDGQVVLSLHYQSGLRASPGRVRLERDLDPVDPIPFLRLRLAEPVARLTLTWDRR